MSVCVRERCSLNMRWQFLVILTRANIEFKLLSLTIMSSQHMTYVSIKYMTGYIEWGYKKGTFHPLLGSQVTHLNCKKLKKMQSRVEGEKRCRCSKWHESECSLKMMAGCKGMRIKFEVQILA